MYNKRLWNIFCDNTNYFDEGHIVTEFAFEFDIKPKITGFYVFVNRYNWLLLVNPITTSPLGTLAFTIL